jgi:hypothetical protein
VLIFECVAKLFWEVERSAHGARLIDSVIRSLNTQTRAGGMRVKIVFARLAPLKEGKPQQQSKFVFGVLHAARDKSLSAVVRRVRHDVIGRGRSEGVAMGRMG